MRPGLFLQAVCFLSLCAAGIAAAATRPYMVDIQIVSTAKEDSYYVELLRLILNASKAPDEVIEFRFAARALPQARWVAAVAQDKGNNVIWTMTNQEREQGLHAIRVPILKGLMGYRLLVIRKGDEAKFAHIQTKEDLLALSVGQGMHWPDTDILRANKFQPVEAMAKENLYKMLAAKRFDFFPRGIAEIYLEEDFIRAQNLRVEPHLILHYQTDLYFFVNKKNTELARRLEQGWDIILNNGEFEAFFLNAPNVRSALEILKKSKRKIIELENPFLPADTPLHQPGYWLDISKLP